MLNRFKRGVGTSDEIEKSVTDVNPRPLKDRTPRLPAGQRETVKWPVLHYQEPQKYDMAIWDFRVFGLVEKEMRWTWDEFTAMPQTNVVSDIHCVTQWSRFDNHWEGIHIREVLNQVQPNPEAQFVMVHADPGYTTNVTLAELDQDDVLFALKHDGQALTHNHGGPLRLVLPSLYFWKSAKWVRGLEFMDHEAPGFWERGGYHVRGDPWLEERFGGKVRMTMQEARSRAMREGRRVAP